MISWKIPRFKLKIEISKSISLLVIIIMLSSSPFITFYLFGNVYFLISTILIILLSISVILLIDSKPNILIEDKNWIISWVTILIALFIYSIFMCVLYRDIYVIRKLIGFAMKFVFLFFSIILIKSHYNSFIKLFFIINIVILIGSILLFIILISGHNLDYFYFIKADNRKHYVFFLGASNALYFIRNSIAIRIAGFADEPGAFALILTYLLIVNELTYKSKFYRFCLILGGLMTFSLAFFISLFFFITYYLRRHINFKRILLLSIIIGLGLLLTNKVSNNAYNYAINKFRSRFERNENKRTFKGDNRSEAFPVQFAAIKKHPIFGIGLEPNKQKSIENGKLSIVYFTATFGLFGLLFFNIPFYYLLARFVNRKELILVLILGLNYLQRPGITDMFSMISLTLIYYSYKFNLENTHSKKIIYA